MQPVPGRRAGLAVDVVLHVAGGENAGDAGLGGVAFASAPGHEVAALHFELAGEQVGIGFVADGDEDAVDGEVAAGAAGCGLTVTR